MDITKHWLNVMSNNIILDFIIYIYIHTHTHTHANQFVPLNPHHYFTPSPSFVITTLFSISFYFLFIQLFFYQLEANYFTILQQILSYIDMNQPWIYMYSPSQSPLPPPSPPNPCGSSQCTRSKHLSHASNLGW